MNIKTLFDIEEAIGRENDFIKKARFLANQVDNEYFVQLDATKNIAARYQTLKSAFRILFDYIIYADDEMEKVRKIVLEVLDKALEGKVA